MAVPQQILATFGSTAFTPASISGLEFWVRADTVTLGSGSAVATWNDQSGHGRDASQATAGQRPTQVSSVINGKPVVRFAVASSTNLITAGFSLSNPISIFIVFSSDGATNSALFNTRLSNADGLALFTPSTTSLKFSINTGVTNTNFVASTAAEWEANAIGSGTSTLLKNAGSSASGTSADIFACMNLGSFFSTTQCSNSDIAEICVYSSTISGSNLTNLRAYFTGRYGLP